MIRDDYWLFVGITFVGLFIGRMVPFEILTVPAMCGIHICLLRRERDLPIRFEMLFDGFHYFVQSLIPWVLIILPMLLLEIFAAISLDLMMFGGLILAIPARAQGPDPEIGVGLLGVGGAVIAACVAIAFVVQTLTIFVYPLIVDKELPGIEAIKWSARAVMGNLGGVLVVMILRCLLEAIAMSVCIGPIFAMPLDLAMVAIAYRQVFAGDDPYAGFECNESPEDDDAPVRPASEGIKASPG